MAYSYPVAYEGTDIKFLLCKWDGFMDDKPYRSVYCPVCKTSYSNTDWQVLIGHENMHLEAMGLSSSCQGHQDEVQKARALYVQATRHVAKESGHEWRDLIPKDFNLSWEDIAYALTLNNE